MSLTVTLVVAALAAVLAAVFGWFGSRPPDPHRGPRMIPYRFLMVLSAAVVMMMLVHLANIAGLHTGR